MISATKRSKSDHAIAILLGLVFCSVSCAAMATSNQQPRLASSGTKQGSRMNIQNSAAVIFSNNGKTSAGRSISLQQQQSGNKSHQRQEQQVSNKELSTTDRSDSLQQTTSSLSSLEDNSINGQSTMASNLLSSRDTDAQVSVAQQSSSEMPSLGVNTGTSVLEQDSIIGQQQINGDGTETSVAVREILEHMLNNDNKRDNSMQSFSGDSSQSLPDIISQQSTNEQPTTPSEDRRTDSPTTGLTREPHSSRILKNPKSNSSQTVKTSAKQQQEQIQSLNKLVSTPSSISMSLDGMIVNSRPRIDTFAANEEKQRHQTSNGKMRQPAVISQLPTSRIGELRVKDSGTDSGGQNGFAIQNRNKVSRRVPFSGMQFSSPASKGFRTKPRASNQVGSSMGPAAQAINLINQSRQLQQTDGEYTPVAAQMNQFFGQQQPIAGFKNNFVQQQQEMHNGFDGDQQVQLDMNQIQQINDQSPMTATEIELMRNLLASNVAINTRSPNSKPDDMVMSVMSSADGKNRRLVMIARNTLDALQKFAVQNSQAATNRPRYEGTKDTRKQSRVINNRPKMSKPLESDFVTERPAATNWMVVDRDTWASNISRQQESNQQQQQQQNESTSSVTTRPEIFKSTNQQQQQQELQQSSIATTSSPSNPAVSPEVQRAILTTTRSATQATLIATTTDSPKPVFQNSQISTRTTPVDSFREVAVSTSTSATNDSASEQESGRSASLDGGSKQQAFSKLTKDAKLNISGSLEESSNNQSTSAETQQISSGQRGIGNTSQKDIGSVKSKKKNNSTSGTKQTSIRQRKPVEKQSIGQQRAISKPGKEDKKFQVGGSKKIVAGMKTKPKSKTVTNGQQLKIAAIANVTNSGTDSERSATTTSAPKVVETTESNILSQQQNSGDDLDKPLSMNVESEKQATVSTTTTSSSVTSKQSIVLQAATTTAMPTTQTPMADFRRVLEANSTFESGSNGGSTVEHKEQIDRELDMLERSGQMIPTLALSGRPMTVSGSSSQSLNEVGSSSFNAGFDSLRAAIPGEPQLDYPIYPSPPKTSFDCSSQSCPGGYYADLETQCQVFHICQSDGRSDTFLCPNGTIFSQQHFVCVWWWQVDCQQSQQFYKLNDGIYCNNAFSTPSSASQNSMTDQSIGTSSNSQLSNSDAATSTGSLSSSTQVEGQGFAQGISNRDITDKGTTDDLGNLLNKLRSDSQQQNLINGTRQLTFEDTSSDYSNTQQEQQLEFLSRA